MILNIRETCTYYIAGRLDEAPGAHVLFLRIHAVTGAITFSTCPHDASLFLSEKCAERIHAQVRSSMRGSSFEVYAGKQVEEDVIID